jgi:hypothetical protein
MLSVMSIAFTSLCPAEPQALRPGAYDTLVVRSKLLGADLITKDQICIVCLSTRRSDRLYLARMAGEYDQINAHIQQLTTAEIVDLLTGAGYFCEGLVVAVPPDWRVLWTDIENLLASIRSAMPTTRIAVVCESIPKGPNLFDGYLLASAGNVMCSTRALVHAMAACTLAPQRIWDHDIPEPVNFEHLGSREAPAVLIEALWRVDKKQLIWRSCEDQARLSAFQHIQLFVESSEPGMGFLKVLLRMLLPAGQTRSDAGWWFEIAPHMLLPQPTEKWLWPIWMICKP